MVFYAQEPGVDRGFMLAQRSGKCVYDVTKLYEYVFDLIWLILLEKGQGASKRMEESSTKESYSEYRTDGTGSVVVVQRVILAVCGRISMRFFIWKLFEMKI